MLKKECFRVKHANTKEKEKSIMTEPGFEPVILLTVRLLVLCFNH